MGVLPLDEPQRKLPPHLVQEPKVLDVKPEDLEPSDVVNIQQRWVECNEYFKDDFIVRLDKTKPKFVPVPEGEEELDRMLREMRPAPIIIVDLKGAEALAERLEMQEGYVQWILPRRRIPFCAPQIVFVPKDDNTTNLEWDRVASSYEDLPVPPTPEKVKKQMEKQMEREKAREAKQAGGAAA